MKYSRVKADVLRSSKRQSLESPMVGFLKLFPLRLASTQLRLIPQWELSSFILPADHCQEAGGRHRQGLEGTKSTPRSCVEGQREKVWKDTHISEMYLLNRCTASCQSELKVHCYQWSDICQMSYCSQSFYTHFINNYKFRIFAPVICHYFDAHSSRFTILKELLLMLQRWDVCVSRVRGSYSWSFGMINEVYQKKNSCNINDFSDNRWWRSAADTEEQTLKSSVGRSADDVSRRNEGIKQ